LDEADEAILTLDRGLIALAAEHQHLCVRRNRGWSGAACQRDLFLRIGDSVLRDRRHRSVGSGLLLLRIGWIPEAKEKEERQECILFHEASGNHSPERRTAARGEIDFCRTGTTSVDGCHRVCSEAAGECSEAGPKGPKGDGVANRGCQTPRRT